MEISLKLFIHRHRRRHQQPHHRERSLGRRDSQWGATEAGKVENGPEAVSPHAGCLAATAPLLIYVLWNGSQRKLNYNSAEENRSTVDRRRSLFVFPSHIKLAHILRKQPPTKTTTTKLVHIKIIIIIIIDVIIIIIQAQLHVLTKQPVNYY